MLHFTVFLTPIHVVINWGVSLMEGDAYFMIVNKPHRIEPCNKIGTVIHLLRN